MAYDEKLADRVRRAVARRERITEKKMFGGLAFLLGGRMCCGVLNDELVVRVGPARYKEALAQPHARRMDFTGKPLTGFVFVAPSGFRSKQALYRWIDRGVEFASTLLRQRTKRTGPRKRTVTDKGG
jgi:TfoX/Sxy family transcriptional regulator of competence genes